MEKRKAKKAKGMKKSKLKSIALNSEIFDQPHQMYAEGMSETKVTEGEVEYFLVVKGYNMTSFESFFDDLQKCWRWTADIKLLESPLEQLKTR